MSFTASNALKYEVVERLDKKVEVRQYGQQTWISTVGTTDNASFSVLASHIFGNNKEGQNVAMTAPVITDGTMSFILPAALSEDSAPTPNGQPIEFTTVAPRQVAALKFSWMTGSKRVKKKNRGVAVCAARTRYSNAGRTLPHAL